MASSPSDKPKVKRTRRTKTEIQEEFEKISKEEQESLDSLNSKLDDMIKEQSRELMESVKDLNAEDIVRKFAELNIDISKNLTLLSEKMVQEVNMLAKVRQAIQLSKSELEKLHKLDVAQTAIDQMIEEYDFKKRELEEDIETKQAEWEGQMQERALEQKEYDDNLAKSRKREIEEYEYKKNLERKKGQDKYEEDMRVRDKQNKERQESLEKSWNSREEELKSREQELVQLRKAVDEFPEKLQKDISKAVETAVKQTEQKLSQELVFLKKDAEAEKRMSDLKIKNLDELLTKQTSQLSALQAQLDEAKKQVQDIAVKAIEGASGAKALSHINQIAMEQAKGRPGNM